jgi:hypothetical protein
MAGLNGPPNKKGAPDDLRELPIAPPERELFLIRFGGGNLVLRKALCEVFHLLGQMVDLVRKVVDFRLGGNAKPLKGRIHGLRNYGLRLLTCFFKLSERFVALFTDLFGRFLKLAAALILKLLTPIDEAIKELGTFLLDSSQGTEAGQPDLAATFCKFVL